jgi:hypothetical protein
LLDQICASDENLMSEPAVAAPLLPPLAQDCDIHIAPEALLPHRTPLAVATYLGEACAAPVAEFRTREPSATISEQQVSAGSPVFKYHR